MNDPQILLQELVEAVKNLDGLVEVVNRPDWWTIGITAVNAVIVIGLTLWQLCLNKRQTQIQERQNELQEQQLKIQEYQNELQEQQVKLQEQQNKQQEYEFYRSLYVLVEKINFQANVLLNRLYEYFSYPIHDLLPDRYLRHLLGEINTLDTELQDKLADFELKFEHNMQDAEWYRSMIADMRLLIQLIERLEDRKQMEYIEDTKCPHPGIKASQGDASSIIEALVAKVTHEPYKDFMRQRLETYWLGKEDLLQLKTLEKIRARCKIN